jgi:hypothetical protein
VDALPAYRPVKRIRFDLCPEKSGRAADDKGTEARPDVENDAAGTARLPAALGRVMMVVNCHDAGVENPLWGTPR